MTDDTNLRQAFENSEIGLVELVRGLWLQKWLVISVVVLATVLSATYAFLSIPVYETHVTVLPPGLSDVAEFNVARTADNGLTPFTVDQVYSIFTRNLQSESIRQQFFKEIYMPSLQKDLGSQNQLYEQLSHDLSVNHPTKEQPERYSVAFEHHDPEEAAKWSKQYVDLAAQCSMDEMLRNAQRELEVKGRNIQQQISMLRQAAKSRRTDRIAKLKEALQVAEAVGLESPPLFGSQIDQQLSSIMEGSLMYMRGAKALRAEIEVLENRVSDDPFIPELRGLQEQFALYEGLKLNADRVAVFRQDGYVEVPDDPIKPRKTLIIVLGVFVGGVLGIFIALIRLMLKKHRDYGNIPTERK